MFEHIVEAGAAEFDAAEEYPWLDPHYRENLTKVFGLAKVPTRYARIGLLGLVEVFSTPELSRYFAAGLRWVKDNGGRSSVFVGPQYTLRDFNLIAAGLLLKFPRYQHFVVGKGAAVSQVEGAALPCVVPLDSLLSCKGREELADALPYFGEYPKTYMFPDLGETRGLSKWDMDKIETAVRMVRDSGNSFVGYVSSVEAFHQGWKGSSKTFCDYLLNPDYADTRVWGLP